MRRRLINKRLVSACSRMYRRGTVVSLTARCQRSKVYQYDGKMIETLYGHKYSNIERLLRDIISSEKRPTAKQLWVK